MRSHNDGLATDDTGQRHDDAGLRPSSVADEASSRKGIAALLDGLVDTGKEPLGSLDAIAGVEVAVVEASVLG